MTQALGNPHSARGKARGRTGSSGSGASRRMRRFGQTTRQAALSPKMRIVLGLVLVASPWAAYQLGLLAGFVDGVFFAALVTIGVLAVVSGLASGKRQPAQPRSGAHAALHALAVLALAAVLVLLTVRALGQA